jgi:hypothetical protein
MHTSNGARTPMLSNGTKTPFMLNYSDDDENEL